MSSNSRSGSVVSLNRSGGIKKRKESIITQQSIEKEREEVHKYNEYFDSVISDHTPKTITKVEKAMIDPLSPFEVKTGSITKYGHRQLDDWTGFHKSR